MRKIILTLMLLSCICMAKAIPADPTPIRVTQPDGSIVTIQLHGDEWLHFTTTTDGYTVVNDERGYYVYAQLQDGKLLPTNVIAHDADGRDVNETDYLSHVKKYLTPQMDETTAETKKKVRAMQRQALQKRKANQYDYTKFRGLIILVEFNDRKFSRSDFHDLIDNMANQENYDGFMSEDGTKKETCTGSVRDYFHDNSNGLFNPQFDVVGPYTVDYSQLDANARSRFIFRAVVNAADDDIDYSKYDGDGDGYVDAIYFLVAGYSASYTGNNSSYLWPHESSLSDMNIKKDDVSIGNYACSTELYGWESNPSSVKINGIGTFCHEFSHVLGLPDFYDTDYEGGGGQSNDPNIWSVMAGGSSNNYGRTPCAYSLYERKALGFATPNYIDGERHYTLHPIGTSNTGYLLNTSVDDEYFLLENRQKDYKWDKYLPGSGLLVFRVDRSDMKPWYNNTVNNNPDRMYYELLRAGGIEHQNSIYDPFPGKGNVTELSNETSPAHLKTHDGQETGWALSNIQMENGIVSFDVKAFTSGISSPLLLDTETDAPRYNLNGQRVDKHYKGIVIQGGKKYLSK